jgi:hypothetical protein
VDWPAAVESSLWPAHPPASATSRTIATRRAADRRVPAGMRKPPPALRRGEGRVPTRCAVLGKLAASQGDGAAATATSFDDAPCPTGRGSGSLASRSAVLTANITPTLVAVENATNADVVMAWSSELRELEQYASVRAGSARHREPRVGWPLAQATRMTPASGSDCGPEGRGFESRPRQRGAALRLHDRRALLALADSSRAD